MKRVMLGGLALLGACSMILGPEARTDPQSIYDSLWRDFDRHYSYFEHKNIDWKAQGDAARPAPNATAAQLFSAIGNLLAVLDDPHVTLRSATGTSQSGAARAGRSTFYSQALALSQVSQLRVTPSGQIRFGILSPGTGYARIASFGGFGWGREIGDAIEQMNVSALVIDVRNNGGGNNSNSIDIANRFTDQRRTVGFYRYRNGPKHSDFTPPAPIEITPDGARFTGRVVVLCNRRCASATEDFLLRMRAIPGVLLIGDTSMGAVGNPLQRELANGWSYQFSEWLMLTPEMEHIEDVGIPPHIVVLQTATDSLSNIDRALNRAINEIAVASAASPRRTTTPP